MIPAADSRFGEPICLPVVESTNDYIRRFIPERRCRTVVAAAQTAGRGRFGRDWYSPPGQGLYVSYLFFPEWGVGRSEFLNVIPSLAVVRALRLLDRDLAVRIKPPNDVLVGGRKISGILAELASTGETIDWAVVGIGLNLAQRAFPVELPAATSLVLEGVTVVGPDAMARLLTTQLESGLRAADQGEFEALAAEYEREKS